MRLPIRKSSLSALWFSATFLAKEAKIASGDPESEVGEVQAVHVNETATVLIRQSWYSPLRPTFGGARRRWMCRQRRRGANVRFQISRRSSRGRVLNVVRGWCEIFMD